MVLIGYSQGALVIHLALRELEKTEPALLAGDNILAVAMLADPAKMPYPAETTYEEPNKMAGSGVAQAPGIWNELMQDLPTVDTGSLPSAVTARTYAFCANHDPVCAPAEEASYLLRIRSIKHDMNVHTSYTQDDMHWLGEKVGQETLGLLPAP